jgi:hypothetical protein
MRMNSQEEICLPNLEMSGFYQKSKEVARYGANFEDGYRAAVICDAILKSESKKKQVDIRYNISYA